MSSKDERGETAIFTGCDQPGLQHCYFFGGRGKVFVIAVMSHDVCHPIGCYILHLLAILYSVALTQVNLMD